MLFEEDKQNFLVRDPKLLKDYSLETAEALGEAESLAKAGRLQDAVALIELTEKKARNGYDGISTARMCVWVLEKYFESKSYEEARQALVRFSRKRGQLKLPISKMVATAMTWLDHFTSDSPEDVKHLYATIEVICSVCEGKIFVEVERARAVRRLAELKEKEGDLTAASAVLQEVAIETNIAMDPLERADFVLAQLRLTVALGDLTRCQIVSRRLSPKSLEQSSFNLVKLRFLIYNVKFLLLQIGTTSDSEEQFEAIGRAFESCLNTELLRKAEDSKDEESLKVLQDLIKDKDAKGENLIPQGVESLSKYFFEAAIIAYILAPETPARKAALLRLKEQFPKLLATTPSVKAAANNFTEKAIIQYPPAYMEAGGLIDHSFSKQVPDVNKRFLERVIRHNLVLAGEYFSRVRLSRLGELFRIDVDELEDALCTLINEGNYSVKNAKIDRPKDIVHFYSPSSDAPCGTAEFTAWSDRLCRVTNLLADARNLIEKERLIQHSNAAAAKRR